MLKVTFFCFWGREADGFLEVGHKMSHYILHIKSGFRKNLHVIWTGEQFEVGLSF